MPALWVLLQVLLGDCPGRWEEASDSRQPDRASRRWDALSASEGGQAGEVPMRSSRLQALPRNPVRPSRPDREFSEEQVQDGRVHLEEGG